MSALTYNGITLPYVLTEKFSQDATYDDSNTDWYLTTFDITVQCVLNYNMINSVAPDIAGDTQNPAAIMSVIRSRLLKPQKRLSFKFNGVELIPQSQGGLPGTVDAKNGPQPRTCILTDLTNNTFLLHYRIEANYWENNSLSTNSPNLIINNQGNNVLYNRWSESVEIDGNNYSTRTREGKFIIRSDNYSGFIADQIRSQMAVVSVPNGFLRESAKYTVTPDGLGLQYHIVDKEVFKGPPAGAFKAKGKYTERATNLGATRISIAQLRLEGSKISSQSDMIRNAVFIARSLINQAGKNVKASSIQLIEATVTRDLYENVVECYMVALLAAGSDKSGKAPDQVAAIAAFANMSTITPGSDAFAITLPTGNLYVIPASTIPPYLDRGTAGILLQAAAYYDPSLVNTKLGPTPNPTAPNQLTGTGPASEQLTNGQQVGTAGKKKES